MNQIRLILVMLAGSLALIGCASFEVELAKKPGFKKVKKVAIVGIVANRAHFIGTSIGSSINAITTMISPDTKTEEAGDDKASRRVLNRLIAKGLELYEKELAKVPGWKIVPYKKISKTKAYARFRRDLEKGIGKFRKESPRMAKMYWGMMTVTPPKMARVPPTFSFVGTNKMTKKQSQEMLAPWKRLVRSLKIDAAASFWLYPSYKSYNVTAIQGVKAFVSVTFALIDRNGRVVAETPYDVGVGKTIPGYGETGDGWMLEIGSVELDEKFEPMLWSSIEKSTAMLRNTLIQEYGGTIPEKKQ